MYWFRRAENMKRTVLKYVKPTNGILRPYMSGKLFDQIEMDLMKTTKLIPYYSCYWTIPTDVKIIFNDELCIVHIDELPNTLAIFVSNTGLENKEFGKGFINELNIICALYNIKTISTSEVIILYNVPLKCYYNIILAILKDDLKMTKPKKKRKKSNPQTSNKYDVEYFPMMYNREYAQIIMDTSVIDYDWASFRLGLTNTNIDQRVKSRLKLGIYSIILKSIKDNNIDNFIDGCSRLCAYNYFLTNHWRKNVYKNDNISVRPLTIDNDFKSLYKTKALIAKLRQRSNAIFTYIINETEVFKDVEFDYKPYEWYMNKYYEYSHTKRRQIWGSYSDHDPHWSSFVDDCHSFIFPNDSMRESYDRLMMDCYRRDIYDEKTYNDYYNYDYEREYVK